MFGQRDDSNSAPQQQAGAPALPQAPAIGMPPAGTVMPSMATPAAPSFSSDALSTPAAPALPASPDPVTPAPAPSFASVTTSGDDAISPEDLARMKQDALQHLQPLVDTLQQSPEEEFRTIMMMIQATDDKTMLKKALDAAKKIVDDKVRAQAMLDVINEINYFAQTGEIEA